MNYFFDNLKNRFDFFLRNNIHFTRRNYKESGFSLDKFKRKLPPKYMKEIENLIEKYNFEKHIPKLSKLSFKDNLYHLDLLNELHLNINSIDSLLDIGSKNFAYLLALDTYFRPKKITGIEIDSNRLYRNFYSRHECAKYYSSLINDGTYIAGDFLNFNFNEKFDIITIFHPFVTLYPLVDWGLPKKYFQPKNLFLKIKSLLKENGKLIVTNPYLNEFNETKNLVKDLFKIEYEVTRKFGFLYDYEVYGLVLIH